MKRWGRRALVSLAFAITAARIYPTVKYALGHGKACMRVVVGGTPVMFDHGRVPAPADMAVRTRVSSASAMSNPAASFEPYRRRLLGLAYRMLGSMADAEDAVQETYLRWHAADRDKVSDPRAFLMTTTTRICLDMLTSARARREEYVGPWLPEPVVDTAALAPDSRTELAEDLSIALLLTLDRLSPLERAAFLLHDVFDFSFSEVATALERSEAACRQLAARARAHVRAARPRGATAPPARSGEIDAKHAQLMSAFVAATRSGDLNALTQLLASDVRVVTDGGGKVAAALNVLDGADRAARFLVGATRKGRGATTSRCALRPSTACPASSWTHPRDRCRPRRSRLRATSFGRCTWCAIRTSCGISRDHMTSSDRTAWHYCDTGTGRPLVLLHGIGMSHAAWNPVTPYLREDAACDRIRCGGVRVDTPAARWDAPNDSEPGGGPDPVPP